MSDLEKLSIYVPRAIAIALDRDAELFEIFKRDGRTINRNRFLSQVLLGYHDSYTEELSRLADAVSKAVEDSVGNVTDRSNLVHKIVQAVSPSMPDGQRGADIKRLSLKPTYQTEGLIREILDDLGNDNRSQYFYGMLASYCDRPSSMRERIVFKESIALLEDACRKRRMVSFSTTWDKTTIHRVVPYKLVAGQDERLNYLLCFEEENQDRQTLAYRLCRISRPHILSTSATLPEYAYRHLALMEQHGPQFAINDDEQACVRLTPKGAITYQRVYLGRPAYERVEHVEGGDLYYFNCSDDQLFLYFRRFGPGEAEVIAPASLRDRVIAFHEGALKMYDR